MKISKRKLIKILSEQEKKQHQPTISSAMHIIHPPLHGISSIMDRKITYKPMPHHPTASSKIKYSVIHGYITM